MEFILFIPVEIKISFTEENKENVPNDVLPICRNIEAHRISTILLTALPNL